MKIIKKNINMISKNLGSLFKLKHGNCKDNRKDNSGIYNLYGSGGIIGTTNEKNNEGNSITIARKGSLNKPLLIKEPYSTIDTAFSTYDFKINVDYIYKIIRNINFEKYSQSSNRPSLTKKIIEKIKVFVHEDLKQQEKIASVLSKQERQIEIIETLIEKLEKRNQYYAEKLLSGEKRIRKNEQGEIEFYDNTEWQDVSLNGKIVSIPKGWEIKNIGKDGIILLNSGINIFSGEKKYYATGEVENLNKYKMATSVVNYNNRPSRANMQPLLNTVWFARMQNTDKFLTFSLKDEDLINNIILSTGFAGLEINKKYDLDYIKHIIKSKYFSNVKNSLCLGATQKAINNSNIKKIELVVCNIKNEQEVISIYLNKIDKEKEILEKLLIKEKLRFQWMLDNLLSGEYKIVD